MPVEAENCTAYFLTPTETARIETKQKSPRTTVVLLSYSYNTAVFVKNSCTLVFAPCFAHSTTAVTMSKPSFRLQPPTPDSRLLNGIRHGSSETYVDYLFVCCAWVQCVCLLLLCWQVESPNRNRRGDDICVLRRCYSTTAHLSTSGHELQQVGSGYCRYHCCGLVSLCL